MAKVAEVADRKTVVSKIPETQTAETVQIKSVNETAETVAVETKAPIETPKAVAVEEPTQKAVAVETPKSLLKLQKLQLLRFLKLKMICTCLIMLPINVTPIIPSTRNQ